MADIFVSYAREDAAKAAKLAAALEAEGWSVFWDRKIPPGETWRSYTGKSLAEARCVVVAWSRASIESHWVQEEAEDARQRGTLLPVLLDAVSPPIGFRSIQADDLTDWDGESGSMSLRQLFEAVSGRLEAGPDESRSAAREALRSKIGKGEVTDRSSTATQSGRWFSRRFLRLPLPIRWVWIALLFPGCYFAGGLIMEMMSDAFLFDTMYGLLVVSLAWVVGILAATWFLSLEASQAGRRSFEAVILTIAVLALPIGFAFYLSGTFSNAPLPKLLLIAGGVAIGLSLSLGTAKKVLK